MPAYVAACRNCGRRVDVNWDGDHGRLPAPATCAACGYADGYREREIMLVGALQVACRECDDSFVAEIPVANVDYSMPTGLSSPIELVCKACGHRDLYQPDDVAWLGAGASMPQAVPLTPGQQRP